MSEADAGREQPLIEHLLELRSRLLRAIGGWFLVLIPLGIYSQELYAFLSAPLVRFMPKGTSMIATEIASPFLTPLKLSAVVALALAMPWILYQIWAFVAPGLYRHERRLVVPLLASSTALFYLGVAMAYFMVLPTVFHFLIRVAPEGVAVMTDINKYLDFVLSVFLAFGIVFETPVAIVLLVWTGFVTPATLSKRRDYVLVGCFVVAAVLTPPDIGSQIMLAIPTYLLYELGIIAAKLLVPASRRQVEARTNP
jgi:sec-independent protein translocase protein TatC